MKYNSNSQNYVFSSHCVMGSNDYIFQFQCIDTRVNLRDSRLSISFTWLHKLLNWLLFSIYRPILCSSILTRLSHIYTQLRNNTSCGPYYLVWMECMFLLKFYLVSSLLWHPLLDFLVLGISGVGSPYFQ